MFKQGKSFEEKKITNYFMISKDKYRLCFIPKENTKNVSILLNCTITCFGPILRKIISLKKYNLIKIYTKSGFITENEELNEKLISEIVVEDYFYTIYDLNVIRNSQEEGYSLFCLIEIKGNIKEIKEFKK